MSEQIILYYSHDPMCSFCWAFRPTWAKVKRNLACDAPQIKLINLLGGLAPDSDEPMPDEIKLKVSNAWRTIEKRIPGTQFNFDFWIKQQPRRSTYPACRAVFAAKVLAPDKEEAMILAIQQAYYLNAQNPSNDDTLIKCAELIGIDKAEFTPYHIGAECNQGFKAERALSQSLGINSFPSLVLTKGNSRFNIPIEYNDASLLTSNLLKVMALL